MVCHPAVCFFADSHPCSLTNLEKYAILIHVVIPQQ